MAGNRVAVTVLVALSVVVCARHATAQTGWGPPVAAVTSYTITYTPSGDDDGLNGGITCAGGEFTASATAQRSGSSVQVTCSGTVTWTWQGQGQPGDLNAGVLGEVSGSASNGSANSSANAESQMAPPSYNNDVSGVFYVDFAPPSPWVVDMSASAYASGFAWSWGKAIGESPA